MRDRWPAPPHDAPLPKVANPPGPLKKPTLRRYSWARLHAELVKMDEWALVADMARSERSRVEALVVRLDVYASTNQPRGSIEGFPLRALAATWRCEADELARIFAALEHPDVGWLEDDVIVTFWERNPDEEDASGPLRSRRSRKRRKIKTKMLARGATAPEILAEFEAQGVGYPQTRCDTRVAVSVTARTDQIKQADEEAEKFQAPAAVEPPQAVHKDSGDSVDNTTALTWLAFHGQRLMVERLEDNPTLAQTRVERWLRDVGGDAIALVRILRGLQGSDLIGARFLAAADDARRRHRQLELGPRLPLGPALAADNRRKGHG